MERRDDWQIVLLLVLVAFAIFANSLGNGFLYDDQVQIVNNKDLRELDYLATIFTRSFSKDFPGINFSNAPLDYYRPFHRMINWLAFQSFGLDGFYWHLLNLLIYCGVVALAYVVIKQLSGLRSVAAAGALLFAIHPIHSESVAWVNCFVETLHALFFLGAFTLYLREGRIYLLGSMVLVMAALLTKELALCFPIIVAAYYFICCNETGFVRRVGGAIWSAAPFFLVIAIYFILRALTYGGIRFGGNLPLSTVLLTIPRVVLEYFRMLVFPIGLSVMYKINFVTSVSSLKFWLPLALLFAMAIFFWFRMPRKVVFACAWLIITLLPVLNIGAFTTDLNIQDRFLFLPSLGFCAAVAIGFDTLLKQKWMPEVAKRSLVALFIIYAVCLSGLAVRQNSFWKNDVALFSRATEQNPDSELAHCFYANALYNQGEQEKAANHYTIGFKLMNGGSPCSCMGLALYYANKGNYDQAVDFYLRAVELGEGESNLFVFTNLANAYSKKGEPEKAIDLLGWTLALHPEFQYGQYALGCILLDAGRRDEGIKRLQRALDLNPNDAGARVMLGQAYEELGLRKEAVEQYRLALSITPDIELARERLTVLEK
jgi:protein O-mannosyl-transferase